MSEEEKSECVPSWGHDGELGRNDELEQECPHSSSACGQMRVSTGVSQCDILTGLRGSRHFPSTVVVIQKTFSVASGLVSV